MLLLFHNITSLFLTTSRSNFIQASHNFGQVFIPLPSSTPPLVLPTSHTEPYISFQHPLILASQATLHNLLGCSECLSAQPLPSQRRRVTPVIALIIYHQWEARRREEEEERRTKGGKERGIFSIHLWIVGKGESRIKVEKSSLMLFTDITMKGGG